MKYEKSYRFIVRLGVLIYLIISSLIGILFLTTSPSTPVYYKKILGILNILSLISITISLLVLKINHRYTVSLILMILSTMFFILSIYSTSFAIYAKDFEDVMKMLIHTLVSNIIIVVSMIVSYKKYNKFKNQDR